MKYANNRVMRDNKGLVIWLTGLSGAGKTTLAKSLSAQFKAAGLRVETLDGDEVRENLSRGLGFSEQDRNTNIRRIGFVARLLARNGVVVLGAAISPYRQSRDDVRRWIEDDDVLFIEVFVRCPVETLVERDVKGLYAKALAGEIEHFTGITDPYEEPLAQEITVDSSVESIEASTGKILTYLVESGALDEECRCVASQERWRFEGDCVAEQKSGSQSPRRLANDAGRNETYMTPLE